LKILLTSDTYYPMVNGVVISTGNLYKQLKSLGHEVRILTLSHTGEQRVDGDIYYLKSFGVSIYPDARAKSIFHNRLVKEIIDWKPDIIHSQTEFSTMFVSKKIAKKLEIPHIHTYHTMYEDYLKYIFKGKLISKDMSTKLTRILLNSLDGIVVPTKKVEDTLLKYGVKKNLYVIPTGIDINKFKNKISKEEKKALLSKLNIYDKKVLVYIGRIAEEKNIEEIIKYYEKVEKENNNITLLIVGGGPYVDKLRKLTDELKLHDKVKFTGMVKPEEVCKYYQLGNAFVTSSTSETQGLTYIEALASGLPVVCRYDPCVANLIIDGENGFTFKDEDGFTEAVKLIVSNDLYLNKLSSNAWKKADEYSTETFGNSILEVYEDTLINFHFRKRKHYDAAAYKIIGYAKKLKSLYKESL
jgi:1,2-diacylglycerol 3-alpha-glucosyltransferase